MDQADPVTTRSSKGSIYRYRTKDGPRYRFTFRDSNGKQSTRRGFRSRRDAQRARERLMGEVHGRRIVVSRETLDGWWEAWLAGRKPYLESGSWNDYRCHGERRILPHLGHRKLTTIAAPEVREWMIDLAESGDYKPKTLNNALTALTVCLNQAVADGLIPANPAAFVRSLPLGHMERDYLRLAEIGRYLDACFDEYKPLAESLIGTGMRIGEALALTVGDIDLERRAIVVARSIKHDGSVGSTKNDRFRRVEIGPDLTRTLAELIALRMERTSSTPLETSLFVMPVRERKRDRGRYSSNGEQLRMDRTTISRDWHPAVLKDAGLRHMPLHSLRHTAAAAWLSTGHPLMYVQRQLGHAQITTTERLYGHLEETFVRQAASATEEAIARARECKGPESRHQARDIPHPGR